MKKTCSTWNNRVLALKDKVTVFNALVRSQIQYINTNTVTPAKVITETRKLAAWFLWSKKRSKVAYQSVIQKIQSGGLRLLDLDSRIRANHIGWIKRILLDPHCSSPEVIWNILGEEDIHLALAFKKAPDTWPPRMSPFYKAVLTTWLEARDYAPSTELDIREEVLWNNHITSSTQHFLDHNRWRHWIEAGIFPIDHICHSSDNRIMGHEEISAKYHIKSNFLEALTFRNSVPLGWRAKISANHDEAVTLKHKICINKKIFDVLNSSPLQWYSEWVESKNRPFSKSEKWNRELQSLPRLRKWIGRPFSSFLTRLLGKQSYKLLHTRQHIGSPLATHIFCKFEL